MLLLKGKSADSQNKMFRLWVHEVYRVFYDRLNDAGDREKLFSFIKVIVIRVRSTVADPHGIGEIYNIFSR